MVNLSVCIEMYWTNLPFDQRIRRVAETGVRAIEFWGWKDKEIERIRAACAETGLVTAAICVEPNWSLVLRGNDDELTRGVAASAQVARSLGCERLIVTTGNVLPDETFEITRRRVVRKLRAMAAAAADGGVTLVLEPLNPFVNHPGYWLTTTAQAADIVEEVASPHLRILYDVYHQQITEGNIIARLHTYAHLIGHIHTGGVPGRHELVGGDLDYRSIFAAIDQTGYNGYVGLEFRPRGDDAAAIAQARALAAQS